MKMEQLYKMQQMQISDQKKMTDDHNKEKNKCKFLIAYLKKHINNLKSGCSVRSTDQNKVHSMI